MASCFPYVVGADRGIAAARDGNPAFGLAEQVTRAPPRFGGAGFERKAAPAASVAHAPFE